MFLWILSLGFGIYALSGEDIIRQVDANMTFGTARFESKLFIHVGGDTRIKEFTSYAQGRDRSFSEFISPPRDQGVKYLKLGDNMWMYLPSVEKIIKIAGHMLRQSMMGSDFSYEDALESEKLLEKYNVKLVGEEVAKVPEKQRSKDVEGAFTCYVLDLTAKVKQVTYYRRKIWVDKATLVPVKEELFAKSGKKLKLMTFGNIREYGNRYYPTYITMQNLLRKGSLTEMVTTRAQFGLAIPAATFTQRNLTK